jgi:hypothetical protein
MVLQQPVLQQPVLQQPVLLPMLQARDVLQKNGVACLVACGCHQACVVACSASGDDSLILKLT